MWLYTDVFTDGIKEQRLADEIISNLCHRLIVMGSYPEGVITDPCDGDSGGPLAILRDGRWQLVGVLKVIQHFPEN